MCIRFQVQVSFNPSEKRSCSIIETHIFRHSILIAHTVKASTVDTLGLQVSNRFHLFHNIAHIQRCVLDLGSLINSRFQNRISFQRNVTKWNHWRALNARVNSLYHRIFWTRIQCQRSGQVINKMHESFWLAGKFPLRVYRYCQKEFCWTSVTMHSPPYTCSPSCLHRPKIQIISFIPYFVDFFAHSLCLI